MTGLLIHLGKKIARLAPREPKLGIIMAGKFGDLDQASKKLLEDGEDKGLAVNVVDER